MSVLQRNASMASSSSSSLALQEIKEDNRIVFITSRNLNDDEKQTLTKYGNVLYFSNMFDNLLDLSSLKFDYLVINISDNGAKTWACNNIASIKCRIVLIKSSHESDTEPWMTAIEKWITEINMSTNIIKRIPSASSSIDLINKLTNYIHVPAPVGRWEKLFLKMLPECIAGASALGSKVLNEISN